jgi:TonB family protein
MKAFAKLPNNFLIIGVSAFLTLAACAPVAQDAAHSNSPAETSTFADALTPPGGVPCRFTRPKYTALQRQLGIHGSVHVTYVVSTVGRIDLAIVDKSSGNQELDHAARDAILQGTCAPYVVDGVAHRVVQNTTIVFNPAPVIKPTAPAAVATDTAPSAPAHPAQPALPASPLNRDAAASGAQPAATAAANAAPPAPSSKAPLSLAQAVQEAILQRQGIAPDSTKAALIKRWGQRMHDDPDIGRLLGNGPNHASVFALSPAMRAEFFSEAVLRLSPEERSKLIELTSKALDNAPPDCGGVKDAALVTSRYLPLGSMSDAEVDSYFGVTFAMFKLSAQQTPVAHVTEEQRAEASRAVANTLQNMLKNDPDGIRNVAAAVADPTGVSAEVWCTNARLYNRALLATPQPYRDWSIVASDIDGAAKLKALGGLQMPATGQATAASQEYATRVQRLVRPNIVWEGPIINAETAITVRCLPNGTLASATITRSSGNAAWDMAALRAVQRSDPMPTDATGRAPSEFVVVLRPAG